MDITSPLRLAVGSHEAGSGKGCAMNVQSWINGDTVITDLPDCADPMLARIVQHVNDTYCTHRDEELLCAPCSVEVLALADRTYGTSGHGLSELDLLRVWVRVAAGMARRVLHLTSAPEAERAVLAAEAWADNPTTAAAASAYAAAYAANAAANAAYAAAADDAAYAAYAAAYAANAAAAADDAAYAAYAAYAAAATTAADAAYAAAYAAADASRGAKHMEYAHLAIDDFLRLTGLTEHRPEPQTIQAAVRRMVSV